MSVLATLSTTTPHLRCFDDVVGRYENEQVSFSEGEALQHSHWEMGEDARLREDSRFRQTPWGRWILSRHFLANEALFNSFCGGHYREVELVKALEELGSVARRTCVFCSGDDRFVLRNGVVRLSSAALGSHPLVEPDIGELERYRTHLPLHSLKAAAASLPLDEWGPRAQEDVIETQGWVRASLPDGQHLNQRMFVAQVEGHSMDDGKSGLTNGALVVFELWPEGDFRDMRVLVRGSFSDPETGTYAVKKFAAQKRRGSGNYKDVSLVSLNPDKSRYPDICLDGADDTTITIVARVVHALSGDEFARRPKTRRKPGRRDLHDPDVQRSRAERLQGQAKRFFEDEVLEAEERAEDGPVSCARFVCMDMESGGLCVETDPMSELPPFVKKVAVSGAVESGALLASNLKHHVTRTPVLPGASQYAWTAPGREEMVADELVPFGVEPLSEMEPHVFRVDQAGVGRLLAGNTISLGGAYRVLLPPSVPSDPDLDRVAGYSNGWRIWELQPFPPLEMGLRKTLDGLGIRVGKTAPSLSWVLHSPAAYQVSPRGEAYPVFHPDRPPIVRIQGFGTSSSKGEMFLIVASANESTQVPLEAGDGWTIELGDLQPGRYYLQVVHERTRFGPVSLPFAVAPESPEPVAGVFSLQRHKDADEAPEAFVEKELDLSALETRQSLTVEAPPLWPLRVWWDDGRRRYLTEVASAVSGVSGFSEFETALGDTLSRSPLACLEIDAAELGLGRIVHSKRRPSSAIRRDLQQLFDQRGSTVPDLSVEFPPLRDRWLAPLLEQLGYAWEEPPAEDLAGAPTQTTAMKLLASHFDEHRRVRQSVEHALVVVSCDCDLDATDMFSARRFADNLCQRWAVQNAIVTDGLRWAVHRRHSHLQLKILSLGNVLSSDDLFAFQDFLRDFANPATVEN